MNAKILLSVCVAAVLLGGPVLAENTSSQKLSTARVTKVVKIPGMDKAPVPVKKVCPAYPYDVRREGIQGIVTVDMLIDSTGRVVATELVNTTQPDLNTLVLAAAKEWTFEPATAKGQPIMTRVRVPFEFSMPQLVAMEAR